ncbi:uncharacterized protein GGS22DRAFT_182029 [Annulohypoxylon maeteangense]|uniref:uncharacterized protein n=1 Tax=Annulohypoxylon maeteangense TaxID=1927788 RepID=UPI0020078B71|nr:uncharacterized protein GGS22DRAFT_182029 [Annulohypoxylon maeteangense]KAI0880982.1 hypothetical protein GGS22DRAFT_182029 [Annulohypoxylon maeteangense]
MDRLNPLEPMRSVIQNALPHTTVESINQLPSCRLLRFFSVKISDGRTLLLSMPPPPIMRLLRSERAMNLSETLATKWILEEVLQSATEVENTGHGSIVTYQNIGSQSGKSGPGIGPEEIRGTKEDMLRFLPILVAHSPSPVELGSPFNIFEPPKGISFSGLPTPLNASEKKAVDFQRGQLVRRLSNFTSPNGFFGPAIAVIGSRLESTDPRGAQLASFGIRGARTWRQAFHALLEGVLRDAEDMAVTFSYEPIRGYFNRLGYLLDGVTTSRLVILDASDESNILVSRSTKSAERGEESHPYSTPTHDPNRTETEVPSEKSTIDRSGKEGKGIESLETLQPTVTITGLLDWSNCIFGDPLFAEVFSRDPSSEFLCGFHGNSQHNDGDFVEDRESAQARLLLYECYHATVGVVKQFYRPGPNSSDREITARRRLVAALKRLQEVDEEAAGKRPRRPSANVEVWPVKKPRGDRDSPGPNIGTQG